MQEDPIQIRPLADSDHAAVVRFVDEEWGAPISVAHGAVFRPAERPGFIAHEPGGRLAGLLTYAVRAPFLSAPRVPAGRTAAWRDRPVLVAQSW
ncbi:MAG TPA: hypothetical protein VHY58_16260 [Streptosporangiaceae bacterium]|nr:hypothetical protein [Streptosporangiaceae bacterium]